LTARREIDVAAAGEDARPVRQHLTHHTEPRDAAVGKDVQPQDA
jgi:hypothetical protein